MNVDQSIVFFTMITLSASLLASAQINYDMIVAKDGSGTHKTVQSAFDTVEKNSSERTVIYIKSGTYKENLTLESDRKNVTIIGEDRDKVKLTYDNYANKVNPATGSTYGTSGSSSTFLNGEGFCALNVTFENAAGPVGQAVAIRITGDKAIFYQCNFLGRQDTWYGIRSRHFIRKCYIEGTTDFMFGSSTTWFDSCTIHSYGGTALTAASTEPYVPYGFIYRYCTITGKSGVKTHLGRPWRPYSAVSFQYCNISSCIKPAGWDNWGKAANEKTARYSEYKNTGSGANTGSRVRWAKQLTENEYSKYTIANVMKTTYADPPVVDNWNPLATLERYTSPTTRSVYEYRKKRSISQIPIRVHTENGMISVSSVAHNNIPITMSIMTIDGRIVYRSRISDINKQGLTINGLLSGIYVVVTEMRGLRWPERIILN